MKRKSCFTDSKIIKKSKLFDDETILFLLLISFFGCVKSYLNFLILRDFDTNLIIFS